MDALVKAHDTQFRKSQEIAKKLMGRSRGGLTSEIHVRGETTDHLFASPDGRHYNRACH